MRFNGKHFNDKSIDQDLYIISDMKNISQLMPLKVKLLKKMSSVIIIPCESLGFKKENLQSIIL